MNLFFLKMNPPKPVSILYIYTSFFFSFLGLHLQHMEIPRLGIQSELQLPAYTTATATPHPSYICYVAGCASTRSLTH